MSSNVGECSCMFSQPEVERAVDLQRRSYKLLAWMTDAVERGFIKFDAAHTYASLGAAAYGWLDSHYRDIPLNARPAREDLTSFCNLFGTYLEGSFDLIQDPGERLFSPDAHCFCPMCSWLVPVSRLRPKKLTRSDREQAHNLQLKAIHALSAEVGCPLTDEMAEQWTANPSLREELGLIAYGRDLLLRLDGVSSGPATLALWRRFAWTPAGSPKKDFDLRADAILSAEQSLKYRLTHVNL